MKPGSDGLHAIHFIDQLVQRLRNCATLMLVLAIVLIEEDTADLSDLVECDLRKFFRIECKLRFAGFALWQQGFYQLAHSIVFIRHNKL